MQNASAQETRTLFLSLSDSLIQVRALLQGQCCGALPVCALSQLSVVLTPSLFHSLSLMLLPCVGHRECAEQNKMSENDLLFIVANCGQAGKEREREESRQR